MKPIINKFLSWYNFFRNAKLNIPNSTYRAIICTYLYSNQNHP